MWWERAGLDVRDGRLSIAGRDAESLAREHGTPLYVYDLVRIEEQAIALRDTLEGAGLRGGVRLALKAQREPDVLSFIQERTPWVGLDVCSPGEVDWGMRQGWAPGEISYTGTNLSDRDLAAILPSGCHLNVDLLTQIDRVGRREPGRTIGLRVNPRIGATRGGNDSPYAGDRPTKFGIFAEQLPEALARANAHGLMIDTVHFHVGDKYLSDGLSVFEETIRRAAEMTAWLQEQGCPIVEVNTGGGLGVPQREGDEPLDVEAWAAILGKHLGPLDVVVSTEPGDFLVKECGVHLAEVVTEETRDAVTFAGLDTGRNAMCEHFIYGALLELVLCRAVGDRPLGPITISGHINEGDDLFAQAVPMADVREGDIIAMIDVGGYHQAMSSTHCMRPHAPALFVGGWTS